LPKADVTGDRALASNGARIESEAGGRPPLIVRGGTLRGISYRLPVASAQVKSAILIAGLQAQGETVVIEPDPTRDHTERLLTSFGARIRVETQAQEPSQPGAASSFGREPASGHVGQAAGDFSSAAFFLVAALLVDGSDLLVSDVGLNPTRTGLLDVLRAMGASFEVRPSEQPGDAEPVGSIRAWASKLVGVNVAPALIARLIDEVPLLCVAAACAEGVTRITGARELRVKESDRIAVMASELRARGVGVVELPDGLVIEGRGSSEAGQPFPLCGGTAMSHGDHRIAMALAVAGLVSTGGVRIDGAEVADVSFPGFYAQLQALMGQQGG